MIGGAAIRLGEDLRRSSARISALRSAICARRSVESLPLGALTCRLSPSALSLTSSSPRYDTKSAVFIGRTPRAALYPILRFFVQWLGGIRLPWPNPGLLAFQETLTMRGSRQTRH